MRLVLLHSPLVGPGTWDALAPLLGARGHDVAVPDLTPAMRGDGPYYDRLASVAASAAGDGALLVAHSGGGALVPAIAERVCVAGAIFADALLPHPGRSWFETAPEPLGAHLRGLARDGLLPPWHRWWPKSTVEKMLPDGDMFARFVAGLTELPLAYLAEAAPDAARTIPSAYLQLSGGYKAEADRAASDGWPVARLDLHHLAMLSHPDKVALAIERLAQTF